MDYLEVQATANPEKGQVFTELVALLQKKLWHQITLKLRGIVRDPFFAADDRLIQLHDKFVATIAKHLSTMDYITFVVAASRQYPTAEEAVTALEAHVDKAKEDAQAHVLLSMAVCRRKLELGKVDECKDIVAAAKKDIDVFSGIMHASCQSAFFRGSFEYYKAKGDAVEYYKNCMLYLTYTDIGTIPLKEQTTLAFDVGLAALIGDHTYNFGELLQHPILKALDNDDTKWLMDMLFAFNAGKIGDFENLYKAKANSVKELKNNKDFLDSKVRIMTLMETIFARGSGSRNLTFGEVAEACQMKEDQVERMLMRSFSLGVVKGLIDQVDQSVRIKWVQPRVLSLEQIASIQERLGEWGEKVETATLFVEDHGVDLVEIIKA
jgi:26S proteasome regulatory subunit N9